MAVIRYSLARDWNTYISPNFQVKEFACKDGADEVLISTELVQILQRIRNYFNRPVSINSAYRTQTYNDSLREQGYSASQNSQHLLGKAADIRIQGIEPSSVANYAESLMPTSGGIGVYDTFTHIDVRQSRSRW